MKVRKEKWRIQMKQYQQNKSVKKRSKENRKKYDDSNNTKEIDSTTTGADKENVKTNIASATSGVHQTDNEEVLNEVKMTDNDEEKKPSIRNSSTPNMEHFV